MKYLVMILATIGLQFGMIYSATAQILDRDTVEVCMDVEVRARIRGLEDFELETDATSGSSGANYFGSDYFELESNAPVRIMISGKDLRNRSDRLATQYSIDGHAGGFETGNGTHNDIHELIAETELGDISDQLAGSYSANVRITVVPLVSSVQTCKRVPRPRQPEPVQEEVDVTITPTETVQDEEISSDLQEILASELPGLDPNSRQQIERIVDVLTDAAPVAGQELELSENISDE